MRDVDGKGDSVKRSTSSWRGQKVSLVGLRQENISERTLAKGKMS